MGRKLERQNLLIIQVYLNICSIELESFFIAQQILALKLIKERRLGSFFKSHFQLDFIRIDSIHSVGKSSSYKAISLNASLIKHAAITFQWNVNSTDVNS